MTSKEYNKDWLEAMRKQLLVLTLCDNAEAKEKQVEILQEIVEKRIAKAYAAGVEKGKGL
jgi:hypothetical protein